MTQQEFISAMYSAAKSSNHAFPEYAACEVANDSNWDEKGLIASANNIFSTRAPAKLGTNMQTVWITSKQNVNGKMVDRLSTYMKFDSVADAFAARMKTLKQYRAIYRECLLADTGEEFVMQVSARWREMATITSSIVNGTQMVYEFMGKYYRFDGGRWAVDPQRATKVLALYEANKSLFV